MYVSLHLSIHNAAARTDTVYVIIDFHGGSFSLGSYLEQAPFCAQLARGLGVIVWSVDYRLGPIEKFPAAAEDPGDILYTALIEESLDVRK